jgi:hypothetical protein
MRPAIAFGSVSLVLCLGIAMPATTVSAAGGDRPATYSLTGDPVVGTGGGSKFEGLGDGSAPYQQIVQILLDGRRPAEPCRPRRPHRTAARPQERPDQDRTAARASISGSVAFGRCHLPHFPP